MNAEELERNPRVAALVGQDLSRSLRPPFEAVAFDAAVCTVSVEYLTRPVELFAEAARVPSPGGVSRRRSGRPVTGPWVGRRA